MWWCVVVISCLQATLIIGSSPNDRQTVWIYQQQPQRTIRHTDLQISDNPSYQLNPDSYYEPSAKRALTLLSRWYPFNTLRRNVPSLREQNMEMLIEDADIETRDGVKRPKHQPLRWG